MLECNASGNKSRKLRDCHLVDLLLPLFQSRKSKKPRLKDHRSKNPESNQKSRRRATLLLPGFGSRSAQLSSVILENDLICSAQLSSDNFHSAQLSSIIFEHDLICSAQLSSNNNHLAQLNDLNTILLPKKW